MLLVCCGLVVSDSITLLKASLEKKLVEQIITLGNQNPKRSMHAGVTVVRKWCCQALLLVMPIVWQQDALIQVGKSKSTDSLSLCNHQIQLSHGWCGQIRSIFGISQCVKKNCQILENSFFTIWWI